MTSCNAPRLETDHILLESLQESDAAGVFEFASHEEVAKTVTWEAHRNIQESRDYIARVRSAMTMEKGRVFLLWVVKDKNDHHVIGTVSLTQLGSIRAQIGFVFHYNHWSRSGPMEALRSVIDYSFSQFEDLHRLQSRCLPYNTTSRELLVKLGMTFEGTNYAMLKVRDQIVDLTCYSITRARRNVVWDSAHEESEGGHS